MDALDALCKEHGRLCVKFFRDGLTEPEQAKWDRVRAEIERLEEQEQRANLLVQMARHPYVN